MRIFHSAIILILMNISILTHCIALNNRMLEDDSTGTPKKKLFFDLEGAPHFSSVTSFKKNGAMVSMGIGYLITPNVSASVRIYTGSEFIPLENAKPKYGWLSLGGGGIETTVYPWNDISFKPFFNAGFDLYTISNWEGYNGGGIHVGVGTRFDFLTYLALSFSVHYTYIYFHSLINDDLHQQIFEPFSDRIIGVGIRLTFYPDLIR